MDRHTQSANIRVRGMPGNSGRGPVAVFLAGWLIAWTVGEIFGVRVLGKMVSPMFTALNGGPGRIDAFDVFMAAFVFLWVAGWTLGGGIALLLLVVVLFGRQSVRHVPGGMQLTSAYTVRRVFHTPLFGTAASESNPPLSSGDPALALESLGAPVLPPGWEYEPDPDGVRVLRRDLPRWLGFNDIRYRLHAGALSAVRGRGDREDVVRYDPAELRVYPLVGSWRAVVSGPAGERVLVEDVDPRIPLELARWIAEQTGIEFDPPAELVAPTR